MTNYLFLYTLSFLTHVISIFNFNTKINNILYLLNIFSLIGYCILLSYNNTFFYKTHINVFNSSLVVFNLISFFSHLFPLYLYKNKDNINQNNIEETIFNTIIVLFIYLLLFNSKLEQIYPSSVSNLILLAVFILYIIYIFYKYKFNLYFLK